MKVLVSNYKIVAGSNAIYLTDNTVTTNNAFIKSIILDPLGSTWNFDLKRLLAIINLNTNELIYNPIDSTLGGTANSYGVTLTKNISTYTGNEKLQIWYDALYPQPVLWFSSNQSAGNSSFATSTNTSIEHDSYYFVASNSDTHPVKLVIEESGWNDLSANWTKVYETVIDSATHSGTNPAKFITPVIKFSGSRIRVHVSSAIILFGVPVVTPAPKLVERRFYGQFASVKNNCLDTFSIGSPSSHVYVPPETSKALINFNMSSVSTGYLERAIPITATNNKIDWVTNVTASTATVATNAGYTPAGLATAINTALSGSGIAVSYDTNTKLYTFYSNGISSFHLLFASGGNNANTIANTIGFPKADVFCPMGNAAIASIPMCNFTNVWVEGSNDLYPGFSHLAQVTSGSTTIAIKNDLGWDIKTGMHVMGCGIPLGATVATTNGYNSITITATPTISSISTTLTFYPNVLAGSYESNYLGWDVLYTDKSKVSYPVLPGPYYQSLPNAGYTSSGSPTLNLYAGYVPPTIAVGMVVSGTGIPANTTISNITYNTVGWPTAITMSANASATGSGLTLTFSGLPVSATLPIKQPNAYPASTLITTNSRANYYMEVPCSGYKWLRLNSCIGVSGTDYVAGSFIINEASIRLV